MDHGYRMECDARAVRRLQRKYTTGSAKRAIVKMLQEAQVRLVTARSSYEALDDKVKKAEDKSAFYEEMGDLDLLMRRIDEMVKGVERLGIDLQDVTKAHEHEYPSDDIDDGCVHCGIRRRSGPIRP
jgi:hypothetical protein